MAEPAGGEHRVVFVDGVHYPVDKNGHADLSRPLRWDAALNDYRPSETGEPLHNDVHHQQELELEPGSEG